jgi:hypothetical protein
MISIASNTTTNANASGSKPSLLNLPNNNNFTSSTYSFTPLSNSTFLSNNNSNISDYLNDKTSDFYSQQPSFLYSIKQYGQQDLVAETPPSLLNTSSTKSSCFDINNNSFYAPSTGNSNKNLLGNELSQPFQFQGQNQNHHINAIYQNNYHYFVNPTISPNVNQSSLPNSTNSSNSAFFNNSTNSNLPYFNQNLPLYPIAEPTTTTINSNPNLTSAQSNVTASDFNIVKTSKKGGSRPSNPSNQSKKSFSEIIFGNCKKSEFFFAHYAFSNLIDVLGVF